MNMLPRLLLSLLLVGSLVAPSIPATAAPDSGPALSENRPSLISHLRTELRSNDALRRQNALMDVIMLANCPGSCTVQFHSLPKSLHIDNEMGVGTAIDVNALVPDLLRTYQSGPTDGHRLLALSALINIGNEDVLETLISENMGVSSSVKKTTHQRVAAFLLTEYPELTERTVRSKSLSMDDVQLVKMKRERELKQQMRAQI